MKRLISKLTLFSVLLFGLSGCFLKSVHPLVSDSDAIEFDQIKGTWENEDERFTFIKEGEWEDVTFNGIQGQDLQVTMNDTGADSSDIENPSYLVLYEDLESEKSDSVYFIGKFVQLEGEYYLDLYPFDAFDLDFRSSHFLPVHTFSKIEHAGDSISINLFRDTWIEEQIRDHKVRIRHEALDEGMLITASINELQQFIKKYGNVAEAYRDPISLKRVN